MFVTKIYNFQIFKFLDELEDPEHFSEKVKFWKFYKCFDPFCMGKNLQFSDFQISRRIRRFWAFFGKSPILKIFTSVFAHFVWEKFSFLVLCHVWRKTHFSLGRVFLRTCFPSDVFSLRRVFPRTCFPSDVQPFSFRGGHFSLWNYYEEKNLTSKVAQ